MITSFWEKNYQQAAFRTGQCWWKTTGNVLASKGNSLVLAGQPICLIATIDITNSLLGWLFRVTFEPEKRKKKCYAPDKVVGSTFLSLILFLSRIQLLL